MSIEQGGFSVTGFCSVRAKGNADYPKSKWVVQSGTTPESKNHFGAI
ncbi:hypothetical protein [Neptuniibacter sp.]